MFDDFDFGLELTESLLLLRFANDLFDREEKVEVSFAGGMALSVDVAVEISSSLRVDGDGVAMIR